MFFPLFFFVFVDVCVAARHQTKGFFLYPYVSTPPVPFSSSKDLSFSLFYDFLCSFSPFYFIFIAAFVISYFMIHLTAKGNNRVWKAFRSFSFSSRDCLCWELANGENRVEQRGNFSYRFLLHFCVYWKIIEKSVLDDWSIRNSSLYSIWCSMYCVMMMWNKRFHVESDENEWNFGNVYLIITRYVVMIADKERNFGSESMKLGSVWGASGEIIRSCIWSNVLNELSWRNQTWQNSNGRFTEIVCFEIKDSAINQSEKEKNYRNWNIRFSSNRELVSEGCFDIYRLQHRNERGNENLLKFLQLQHEKLPQKSNRFKSLIKSKNVLCNAHEKDEGWLYI